MVVQWLFNVCSTFVQRLAKGCHHALWSLVSASSTNADAAAVSVSSPMSLGRLVVEIRVYWGRCFSRKAWQKIRMPCAVVRQGRCLDVF